MSIGLRGGDPAGLTVKKYGAGKAWELNIGYTYYWSGSGLIHILLVIALIFRLIQGRGI